MLIKRSLKLVAKENRVVVEKDLKPKTSFFSIQFLAFLNNIKGPLPHHVYACVFPHCVAFWMLTTYIGSYMAMKTNVRTGTSNSSYIL